MRAMSLALFSVLFIVAGVAGAEEPPKSGHPVFDRAVELVMEHFYDPSALEHFSEAVRKEVEDAEEPLTVDSTDDRLDAAIDTVLASLGVSHTGRYKPDTIAYYELADIFRYALRRDMRRLFPPDGEASYEGIGMVAEEVSGKLFVSDVYDGAPADRAGIETGDEILSVDGASYHEIESFRGKAGKTVELRLRRQEGAESVTRSVEVERLRPLQTFSRAIEESAEAAEYHGYRIGYVRLWTLSTRDGMDIVARALAAGPLKDTSGVVVDLRGRWGGGRADAAELFVGDTVPFRLIERDGEEIFANVRWDRPVVAITDEGSRSGLELFAYSLRENGVPLIGARTAGALLAGRAFLLPDDSIMILAVSDAVIGENTRLEGGGLHPDAPVPYMLPYSAGEDPQREAALEAMLRILSDD